MKVDELYEPKARLNDNFAWNDILVESNRISSTAAVLLPKIEKDAQIIPIAAIITKLYRMINFRPLNEKLLDEAMAGFDAMLSSCEMFC